MKPIRILFAISICCTALSARSFGWAYQGHILISRLAALRIINDPTAPQGLRDFLKANMPATMEDSEKLATVVVVGGNMAAQPEYDKGLDHWCTMPDQLRNMPEGRVNIAPYGKPEASMHFMDMEAFGPEFAYKDDLSTKPDVDKIPHDVKDPRWALSGFVPWRVEEFYHKLAEDMGSGPTVARPDKAIQDAGFMAHYTEDSTQPHHSTVDYKSLSYLGGIVAGIPVTTNATSAALAAMHAPQGVDPHGDIEFQLFENADPPRSEYRKEYWKDLLASIDKLAAERAKQPTIKPSDFDPFRWDLHTLSDSYDYLPFVGRAAQAAYKATGTFDPKAFFTFTAKTHGEEMSMIQLIALQNAKAVLNVEMEFRLAWASGHGN
jgi:hypothetical protein